LYDLALDTDSIFACGSAYGNNHGESDVLLIEYDLDGAIVRQTSWGGVEPDRPYAIEVASAGQVWLVGITYSYGVGQGDVFLLEYDSTFGLLHRSTWGTEFKSVATEFSMASDGKMYITGSMDISSDPPCAGLFLLSYDASCNLISSTAWAQAGVAGASQIRLRDGELYFVGSAPTSYGNWQQVAGETSEPTGFTHMFAAATVDVSGTETAVDGSEAAPFGIEQSGGGSSDLLAMRYRP
jgi:hypothetical protein